ncbi:neuronal acetylcholine receptor subunit alpha-5-like [Apostichopus japonicus]|uniref:neuronal acetylcholine receptor subunit alpha-5-like n=1 Tax=Stichopus japonicus TaxID=307972 RepID=UPI003AB7E4CF
MASPVTIFVLGLLVCILLVTMSVKGDPWDRECDEEPGDDYDQIRTPQARLLEMLLDTYGPRSPRPVLNQNTTMYVGLQASPVALVSFEEQSQQVVLKSDMQMTWVDEQLVWDPRDHRGIESVSVSTEDIWIPDITVPESTGESFDSKNNLIATVDYEGNILWDTVVVTSTFCKLLVRFFPFDVQHCNITLTPWIHNRKQLETVFTEVQTEEVIIDHFAKNGMWRLSGVTVDDSISKSCETCDEYSYVRFTLELERTEASFFALNVILPCILLSMMNLLVFFLPPESGEKISFVMTNVLTLVLFQQLVATMLPASGDDTPLLSTHIVTLIMFGCVAIVWTVFVTHLYYKTTPYPKWMYAMFTSFRCVYRHTQFGKEEAKARKTLKQSMEDLDAVEEEEEEGEEAGRSSKWFRFNSVKRKIKTFSCWKCGKENPTILEGQKKKKKARLNNNPDDSNLWQETANLLDRLMGYVMILVTIIIYIILLVNFATQDPHTYHLSTH